MATSDRSTRGDLIFMTPSDNPISDLITQYDRGPYTHVGIDLGDGTVVNCRSDVGLIRTGETGGVRLDVMAEITDRELFRAPVLGLGEAEIEAAIARTVPWTEKDGKGDKSWFSFPKMFQCAVAVDALRPEATFTDEARDTMVGAAFAAAEAWRYVPERPGFFCAEMVVEAYRAEIPTEYLAPPRPPKGLLGDVVVDAAALAREVIAAWEPGGRGRTMAAVVAAVTRYDRDFFQGALRAVWDWARSSGHDDHDLVGTPRGELPDVLPPALVTPRMLLRCDWVGPEEPV